MEAIAKLTAGTSDEQKTSAAKALLNLAYNNPADKVNITDLGGKIADLGGLGPLVELMTKGTDKQKTDAAGALRNLAVNDANKVKIADL